MPKIDETVDPLEIKTLDILVEDVHDTFCSVYINGWYCAVNFSNPETQSKEITRGKIITIEYTGDIEKDTTGGYFLKILPLK